MSIPGVFPPVERDSKVLVDGGLLNNIPTNVMKEEFNPDIVIAVDIGTPLGDMQAISSLFGILQQSITVMLIDNDRRNLRLADIVIAPELGNLSILDFSKIDQTIEIGYKSAQEKAAILDRLSVDDETWQQYVDRKTAKKQNSSTVADRVEVAGVSPNAQQALLKKVEVAIGEPLDTLQLEKSLTEIIGEGRYESLGYQLVPSSNDPTKQTLKIRVKEKSYAPPSINVGIEVEANEANDLNFTVGGRLTLYDIGKYGSELRTDLKLGFRTLVATEYYRPISKNRFLQIATRGFYSRETFPFFVSSRRLGEFQANIAGAGIDLAFLKTRSEVRVGYEIASLNVRQRSGVVPTPLLKDGTANSLRVKWVYDGQDSATISTKGTRISAEGRYYITTTENRSFPQVALNFSHLKPINGSSSLIINFIGSTSFNRDAGLLQQQTVGGPFRLTGFNRNEFRGNHTVIGSLGYLKQIGEISPLVGGRVFAIGMYEVGGAYRNFFAPKLNNSFAGGILVDTRIGPFSIIGGLGQGGRGQLYVSFGQSF
ncbi:MAG: hypothetical protein JNN15_10160, partial [Blastocatellia bacterium]|nr:hypothetical protein [Blastocatellia bacterium]